MENFDHVVDILSSNQLFMPNLNAKDGMDSDVNKWLNAMVTNQSAPVKPFALSHNSSLSDPM